MADGSVHVYGDPELVTRLLAGSWARSNRCVTTPQLLRWRSPSLLVTQRPPAHRPAAASDLGAGRHAQQYTAKIPNGQAELPGVTP
jgi:hypothetical protein